MIQPVWEFGLKKEGLRLSYEDLGNNANNAVLIVKTLNFINKRAIKAVCKRMY